MKFLLAHGARVDEPGHDNFTTLHHAALNGDAALTDVDTPEALRLVKAHIERA